MSVEWLGVFVFLGVAALGVAWVLRSRGGVSAHDDVQAQSEALRRELSVLVEKSAGNERELSLARERVAGLESRERELLEQLSAVTSKQGETEGRFTAALKQIDDLKGQRQELLLKLEEAVSIKNNLDTQIGVLSETVRLKEQSLAELEARRRKADEELKLVFENLSQRLLRESSDKFSERSKSELESLLKPFKETLELTKGELAQSKGAAKEHQEVLIKQVERIIEEADALTRVFKGRNMQAFGELGEELLEGVLTAAGLSRGTHYEVQVQIDGGEEGALRPDVIVKLPDGKHLVIDAKATLKNYNLAVTTEDKKARQQYLEANVSDILARVKELTKKHYDKLKSVKSPDFVLMYLPFEQAYIAALEVRPTLVEDAMRQRVAIVTNSTLLATLRTVSYVWSLDLQQRNSTLIAEQGGKLLDKMVGFTEDMQKVVRAANTCRDYAEDAWKKLFDGGGNLKAQAQKLKELGVKGKKSYSNPLFEDQDEIEPEGEALKQSAET